MKEIKNYKHKKQSKAPKLNKILDFEMETEILQYLNLIK